MADLTMMLFNAFGLAKRLTRFKEILYALDATIMGGAALTWVQNHSYVATPVPAEQDLDICFRPASPRAEELGLLLFDTFFESMGYVRRADSRGAYTGIQSEHITRVCNWICPISRRKIQVVVRDETPLQVDFDICGFEVGVVVDGWQMRFQRRGTATSDEIERMVVVKEMRISSLAGMELAMTEKRVAKYYGRGFSFKEVEEIACACACGAHRHTVKKLCHLTLEEALVYVRRVHAEANPALAPAEKPVVEIPPFLDIEDAPSTPPRRRRLVRTDTSWIRAGTN
jgi:hypothetical protein